MPGYDCQVIMAAGAFTLGASIELSADAPLREPYAAWMQRWTQFSQRKIGRDACSAEYVGKRFDKIVKNC